MTKRVKRVVKLATAADEIGVSVKTVLKYCDSGLLDYERLPSKHRRITRESLDRLLASMRKRARPT